jgi:glycerol-3-phosphate dehydrogenase (NAD(P)+)
VITLSKGVELSTGMLGIEVLGEVLGAAGRLAVLSGPNHAEEVARGLPSATVIASRNHGTALFFQELFAAPYFRVYTSTDALGVQLCGAAKNIIAIATGMAAGKGFGDNTAALIMTRGLAEISRLVTSLGGEQVTCMGLAGMGDLVVTCTSKHSRNRSFGVAVAQGRTLEDYERETHMVVEGALACKSVTALAAKHGIEMPISEVVRHILWDKAPIDEIIEELEGRPLKREF